MSIYLAIKGGSWKAGGLTYNPTPAGNTASVTGMPFAPKGLSTLARGGGENAAGTPVARESVCQGQAKSPTDRRTQTYQSRDAVADSEVSIAVGYAAILHQLTAAGALQVALDLQSLNSDGFTVVVDSATAGSGDWIGYLTFGDAPAAAFTAAATLLPARAALAATATRTTPAYAATAPLTAGKVAAAATATHVKPTYTASAPLVAGKATLGAAATRTTPAYAATAPLTTGKVTCASAATSGSVVRTATSACTASHVTLASAATFAPPHGDLGGHGRQGHPGRGGHPRQAHLHGDRARSRPGRPPPWRRPCSSRSELRRPP